MSRDLFGPQLRPLGAARRSCRLGWVLALMACACSQGTTSGYASAPRTSAASSIVREEPRASDRVTATPTEAATPAPSAEPRASDRVTAAPTEAARPASSAEPPASEAVSEAPTETATPASLAELRESCADWSDDEARAQPAIFCSREDEPLPTQQTFPAISADGAEVAIVRTGDISCCVNSYRETATIYSLTGATLARWLLGEARDDAGEQERVAPHVRDARIAALNRRLYDGGFRAMPLVAEDADGFERVALGDGLTARVEGTALAVERAGAPVFRATVPGYVLNSDCCDGGMGYGRTCRMPPSLVGVWRQGRALVVELAHVGQMDGCDGGPTFRVFAIP